MNNKQFIRALAEKQGCSISIAKQIYLHFTGSILESLKEGEDVRLKGFGIFKTKLVKERKSYDIKTGKIVNLKEKTVPTFVFSNKVKENLL